MTYRVRRKFTSSTFKVNNQYCKVFLTPFQKTEKGFWYWNVGFAVGSSKRQLNDWYQERDNKRTRKINNQLTGKQGVKTISLAFKEVLKLRWNLAPGDSLLIDCTSAKPDKQFRAWNYFCRNRREWVVNPEKREFYWTRPPYPSDVHWTMGVIVPQPLPNLLDPVTDNSYFDCFYLSTRNTDQSIH